MESSSSSQPILNDDSEAQQKHAATERIFSNFLCTMLNFPPVGKQISNLHVRKLKNIGKFQIVFELFFIKCKEQKPPDNDTLCRYIARFYIGYKLLMKNMDNTDIRTKFILLSNNELDELVNTQGFLNSLEELNIVIQKCLVKEKYFILIKNAIIEEMHKDPLAFVRRKRNQLNNMWEILKSESTSAKNKFQSEYKLLQDQEAALGLMELNKRHKNNEEMESCLKCNKYIYPPP